MEQTTGFLKKGNAALYYEVAGEGSPIILLHAGIADTRQWNHEFEVLAAEYQVVRYDRRGFGKSLPAEGVYSHMGDLVALVNHLGLDEKIILIGCSMGGRLAMDFALEHPTRVKALVMVGSGPSGLSLDVQGHPKEAEAEAADAAEDWELLAELETQIWVDGMGRSAADVDPEVRALAYEMNRLAIEHDNQGLGEQRPDPEAMAVDRLDQLAIPILAIVGKNDEPYSRAAADYMVEHIPTARRVIVPDAAHLANMDQPDLFEREVRAFLVDGARAAHL